MSVDIGAEASINHITGETKVSGNFKYQFGKPLILAPCEHLVETKGGGKIFDRKKIWKTITHGQPNGYSRVETHCEKLE
jgi:hypothetical protein